jgi:hypothetical protein
VNGGGETIHDFTFLDDDWIPAADGPGYSMVAVDPTAPTTSWGTPSGWRRSAYVNGSPGAADPPYIDGDFDSSGTVDAADYVLWRRTLGDTVTVFTAADGDGDGTIDQGDYAVWRAHFGESLPAAGVGSAAGAPAFFAASDNSVAASSGPAKSEPMSDGVIPQTTKPGPHNAVSPPVSPAAMQRPYQRNTVLEPSAIKDERSDATLILTLDSQAGRRFKKHDLDVGASSPGNVLRDVGASSVEFMDQAFAELGIWRGRRGRFALITT